MQHFLSWTLASGSLLLLAGVAVLLLLQRRRQAAQGLPEHWALTGRPVFSSSERRLYHLLSEALPEQIILSKLPLVRFCQPTDARTVAYWFGLLGNRHVSFAICSHNGRVLAAIDLDGERPASRRGLAIKQSALAACSVRYFTCNAKRLPSMDELRSMVPAPAAGGPSTSPRAKPAHTPHPESFERRTLWQESSFMQDSFFGMDGGGSISSTGDSGAGGLSGTAALREFPSSPNDVGGVLIDTRLSSLRH
jgi:hypothetical protein